MGRRMRERDGRKEDKSEGRSEGEKENKVFITHCIYSLISLFNKLR